MDDLLRQHQRVKPGEPQGGAAVKRIVALTSFFYNGGIKAACGSSAVTRPCKLYRLADNRAVIEATRLGTKKAIDAADASAARGAAGAINRPS
ncbi:hypothetical protein PO872_00525 [Rhizobium sp. MC62]|nr:hypothetical protein [Rhizobium sp. MC62]MDC9807917.1 hypothetical protein [Rhizobium sp. MC62]